MHGREGGSTPLSIHRAFVVQFRAEPEAGSRRVAGRIEHVASREAAPFRSWAEMRAFITRVLIRVQGPEASE